LPTDTCKSDPQLQAVIDAWHHLPATVRAAIAAIVNASSIQRGG